MSVRYTHTLRRRDSLELEQSLSDRRERDLQVEAAAKTFIKAKADPTEGRKIMEEK